MKNKYIYTCIISTLLLSACSQLPAKDIIKPTSLPKNINFPNNQIDVSPNGQTFTNNICHYSITIPKNWFFEKSYITNNSSDCDHASTVIFSNASPTNNAKVTNLVKVDFFQLSSDFDPTEISDKKYSLVFDKNKLKVYRTTVYETEFGTNEPILKYVVNFENQFYGAYGYFNSYKNYKSIDKIISSFTISKQ